MKCPCCNGEGGYTEPILDFGIGPYYPCDFCKDDCKVSFLKWLEWQWDCVILEYIRKIKERIKK